MIIVGIVYAYKKPLHLLKIKLPFAQLVPLYNYFNLTIAYVLFDLVKYKYIYLLIIFSYKYVCI